MEKEDVMSESGILFSSEDIENMILVEIYNVQQRQENRANTNLICEAQLKSHGLAKRTVSTTLERMISERKVGRVDYRGRESLRLTEQRKEEVSKMIDMEKEQEKFSPRVSNDGATALDFRDELVRISLENRL
eukprot:Seg1451.3 transcript_id=Seg1451.3/GoldUCD/mRNA.D3Y31 product="hypothetical protein" protein_id=Seg1451.3/GoldUCD/D3Y31